MTLEQYSELTGITVAEADTAKVEAQLRRTQVMLESMLGYTLDPTKIQTNLYIELGKTTLECSCSGVDTQLDDPDPVEGAYRLYAYDYRDRFFHIDPFSDVFAVKLVQNGVTIKTLDTDEYRPQYGQFGHDMWGKYIENCQWNLCNCECQDCVQLAVDADWVPACDSSIGDSSIGCVPSDLLYVWADMVTYYANCKQDVKSETTGPHSYTKFDRENRPELIDANMMILRKYAGPHGTLTKALLT